MPSTATPRKLLKKYLTCSGFADAGKFGIGHIWAYVATVPQIMLA